MTINDYTKLHENVDYWYDCLNDCAAHVCVEYPRFNQYMYMYLSCIEEFSNDVE